MELALCLSVFALGLTACGACGGHLIGDRDRGYRFRVSAPQATALYKDF